MGHDDFNGKMVDLAIGVARNCIERGDLWNALVAIETGVHALSRTAIVKAAGGA